MPLDEFAVGDYVTVTDMSHPCYGDTGVVQDADLVAVTFKVCEEDQFEPEDVTALLNPFQIEAADVRAKIEAGAYDYRPGTKRWEENARLQALLQRDFEEESGVPHHQAFSGLFRYAYDQGHAYGWNEVLSEYGELVSQVYEPMLLYFRDAIPAPMDGEDRVITPELLGMILAAARKEIDGYRDGFEYFVVRYYPDFHRYMVSRVNSANHAIARFQGIGSGGVNVALINRSGIVLAQVKV